MAFIVILGSSAVFVPELEAPLMDDKSAAFFIKEDEKIQQKVKLGDLSCTFSYDTHKAEQPKAAPKSIPDAKQLVDQLTKSKLCRTKSKDGWNYQVCLGDKITQSNAGNTQSYNLGVFTGVKTDSETPTHMYEKGTEDGCPSAQQRHTTVKFACGSSEELHSINEPEMCSYLVVWLTPQVCANPAFPAMTATGKDQSWFLQISKMYDTSSNNPEDSLLVCSAQYTGYGPFFPLEFKDFQLSFSKEVDFTYKARHPNRVPFEDNEIRATDSGIQSASKSGTTLQFASIQTKVRDTDSA